jgi:hypothetical protein
MSQKRVVTFLLEIGALAKNVRPGKARALLYFGIKVAPWTYPLSPH